MEVLPTKHWRHVPSKENPADIASRGIDPKCLPDCMLWWQGAPWLRLETSNWPKADPVAMRLRIASSISSSHINTTSLTFSDTKTIEETFICWVQGIHFQVEIQSIKKQISLPPKSPLRSPHPFIDEHGLVRVGGRLQNSQLRFNSKHPIILPRVSFPGPWEIIRFLYFFHSRELYFVLGISRESHGASIIYEVVTFDLTVDFNLGHR
ncbi:uncharacterized protein TNCV_3126211 [Trichonephila clavipes]|nr:uncharacterized protein TNCV_3126211 [Trichonephila clavipes]